MNLEIAQTTKEATTKMLAKVLGIPLRAILDLYVVLSFR